MSLPTIATHLTTPLLLACLIYDYHNFGLNTTSPAGVRHEILCWEQICDLRDIITYPSSELEDTIDEERIGLWGYSLGNGHVMHVTTCNRRVKAVIALGPGLGLYKQVGRLLPSHAVAGLQEVFAKNREGGMKGKGPVSILVVSDEQLAAKASPSQKSFEFFKKWEKEVSEESTWVNQVSVKTLNVLESHNVMDALSSFSPTPVLWEVATRDTNGSAEMTIQHFGMVSKPKEVCGVDADHCELVTVGEARREVDFLKRTICRGLA